MNKTVIGIVGPIASGKGTVIKILEKKGFYSSSTSDRIREEIKKRGEEINRKNLTRVENEVRQIYGNDALARRTAEIIDSKNVEKAVIDSIRNPEEINFLRKKYNAKIIAIVANQGRRYEWFIKRQENSESMSLEEFKELDDKEFYGTGGGHSQRVDDCIKMADFTIDNNGSIEDLERKIVEVIGHFQS